MGTRRPTQFEMLGHMSRLKIGLRGTCSACGKVAMLDVKKLAKRYGHETHFGRIIHLVRCGCGAKNSVRVQRVRSDGQVLTSDQ